MSHCRQSDTAGKANCPPPAAAPTQWLEGLQGGPVRGFIAHPGDPFGSLGDASPLCMGTRSTRERCGYARSTCRAATWILIVPLRVWRMPCGGWIRTHESPLFWRRSAVAGRGGRYFWLGESWVALFSAQCPAPGPVSRGLTRSSWRTEPGMAAAFERETAGKQLGLPSRGVPRPGSAWIGL